MNEIPLEIEVCECENCYKSFQFDDSDIKYFTGASGNEIAYVVCPFCQIEQVL